MGKKIDIEAKLAAKSWCSQKFDYEEIDGGEWNSKTISEQERKLEWYNSFLQKAKLPEQYSTLSYGFTLPPPAILKQFAQFFAENISVECPSYRTVTAAVSMVTSAMRRISGLEYSKADIQNVHGFVKSKLVKSKVVSTKERPKFSFGPSAVTEVQRAVWTTIDPNANPLTGRDSQPRSGRMLIFGNALARFYVTFGARISAALPRYLAANPDLNKDEATVRLLTGIRYKDIEVRLVRSNEDSAELVMTFAQRFIKNNWDTDNSGIKTWAVFRSNFLEDCMPFVLAFGFANNAFQENLTPTRLLSQRIPDHLSELPIRWRSEMCERYIFSCDVAGMHPISQQVWDRLFKSMFRQAGYYGQVTVHRMRQAAANNVSRSGVTPSQHKHALGQTTSVYDRSYVDSVTSIDMQAVIRSGEQPRTDIVDILTGPEAQRCAPMTHVLSLERRSEIVRNDPVIQSLQQQLVDADPSSVKKLRGKINVRKRSLLQKAEVQSMVEAHEDQIRQAFEPTSPTQKDVSFSRPRYQKMMQFMPEFDRVARAFNSSCEGLEAADRLRIINDLVVLAKQTVPEAYRPGEAPIDGKCPVTGCQMTMQSDIALRWTHVHNCRRNELQRSSGVEVTYCFFCLQWLPVSEHTDHMSLHLVSPSMDCGVFCFSRGLLIQPGLCPVCLGDELLDATVRLFPFQSRQDLTSHILTKHLSGSPPSLCPHPSCTEQMNKNDWEEVIRHCENVHGIDDLWFQLQSRWPKRKSDSDGLLLNGADFTTIDDRPVKKARTLAAVAPPGEGFGVKLDSDRTFFASVLEFLDKE